MGIDTGQGRNCQHQSAGKNSAWELGIETRPIFEGSSFPCCFDGVLGASRIVSLRWSSKVLPHLFAVLIGPGRSVQPSSYSPASHNVMLLQCVRALAIIPKGKNRLSRAVVACEPLTTKAILANTILVSPAACPVYPRKRTSNSSPLI